MTAELRHSSAPTLPITPNEDGAVYSTLTKDGAVVGGREGTLRYDYAHGYYTVDIPLGSDIATGTYQLDFTGSCGAETVTAPTTNIKLVREGRVSLETNKSTYRLGESIYVSGSFLYSDGTPVANERVVLDYQLLPALKEPRKGTDAKGNEIFMRYQAEEIVFVQTDENGSYSSVFTPFTGEAGEWTVNAFGYENMMGVGASTSVQVWGLVSSPSSVTIAASENSQFSKEITVKFPAPANPEASPLTGLTAALTKKSGSGISASLDTSSMTRTLGQGATASVTLNVSAELGCSETADYEIMFSTDQGAWTKTTVHLNLIPATPLPVTDPKKVSVGLNPGDTVSRVLTVTNKGKGTLTGLKAAAPAGIPWVTAGSFGKNTLMPGESTTFTVTFAPGESVSLGQYQDKLTVSDAAGKFYANVALSAEVTALRTGGISLRVSDDVGSLVPNATVTIISKEEYTSMAGGVESTYYESYSARTDENGIAQFYDKPLGEYDLVVTALGREKYVGECEIMPSVGAPFTEVTLKNLPVQIEWTVVPTTIVDEYEIKLELTFGAHIPSPSFGFNPPWVNIPKNVSEPIYVEANVVNTGLIALTDVVASIVREKPGDMGISIVGGGYIGEIAAQSSARIRLLVQPGVYNLPYGTNAAGQAKNYIRLEGSYVSFDPDTGLPVDPAPVITGSLPLYNPSSTPVTVTVRLPENGNKAEEETIALPEGQMEEFRYIVPQGADREKELAQDGGSVYEIVKLSLDQTATLERQAFDATLRVTNGYPASALNNLRVDVLVKDENGLDVSNKNFIIATGISGISDVDGNGSLASGSSLTATWQIIPGSGLGGTSTEGQVYYASALVSYYVNGKLVQTETDGVPITILPQPKLTLNYFVPHNILSNMPFRLGVTVENYGYGEAMNLNITSGQLQIDSNQSGMITDFEIIDSSFGSKNGSEFTLSFGNVPAAAQTVDPETGETVLEPGRVTGYWIVRWNMPVTDGDPYEGEFRDFKATLTHKDYKGVQLNPLITAVTTAIIGKDGLLSEEEGEGGLTLVNEGTTGFPDKLIDLRSGIRVPIHVPDSLTVTDAYDGESMTVRIPAAGKSVSARYQVIMIPEPEGCGNIASVTAAWTGGEKTLSPGNYWKDYGYIYIVAEIPTVFDEDHSRVPAEADYTISFGSSARLEEVSYSRFIYTMADEDDEGAIWIGQGFYLKKEAFYDTGVYPDVGDTDLRLLAVIDNRSRDVLSGYIVFTATADGSDVPEHRSADIAVDRVQPYARVPVYYSGWTPQKGTGYTVTAELHDIGGRLIDSMSAPVTINDPPHSHAGPDIADGVMGRPVRFDGSASYDKDGYISSFVWDFGDGESGNGPTPTHVYQKAGTYKAKLYVSDNNLSDTYPYERDPVTGEIIPATVNEYNYFSEIQVTVNADCPDLFVNGISFSNDAPAAGERVTLTATVQNGTLPNTGGLTGTGADAYYLVGFYRNDKYIGFAELTGDIPVGGTADVSIDFAAEAGPQKLTAIVNDIGRNIREVNYDNNRLDRVLAGSATDFADLAVSGLAAGIEDGDTVSWGQAVNVGATVRNIGSADAESFKVLLYDDSALIGSVLIDALAAGGAENISFIWTPERSGSHTLTFTADGPVSSVVEMQEENNTAKLDYASITVRYPDLKVDEVSTGSTGTSLAPGQNLVLTAKITNAGKGDAVKPTTVAFYASNRLVGNADAPALKAGESAYVSLLWKDPAVSVTSITAVADAYEALSESAEGNNIASFAFDTPLKVSTAVLEISDITTTGAARFGDEAETAITVINSGERSIDEAFNVALYVGTDRVGLAEVSSLAAGETAAVKFAWTARQCGSVTLRAYADAESRLVLENRGLSSAIRTVSVAPGLILTAESDAGSYGLGDTVEISASVRSSDAMYLPREAESLTAALAGTGETVELVYDDSVGAYSGSFVPSGIGAYTVLLSAALDGMETAETVSFTVSEDFRVILTNEDARSYPMGGTIPVSGFVTAASGDGLSGIPVSIAVVGAERYTFTAASGADGHFEALITLPEGTGGAFSLRASAEKDGIVRRSERVSFYVDGLWLAFEDSTNVIQGYETILTGYVNNPGVAAETVGSITVDGLPDGLSCEVLAAPGSVLKAGGSEEVRISFTAAAGLAPGEYPVFIKAGAVSRKLTVVCVRAEAIPRITVIGMKENESDGLETKKITLSLRQGAEASAVIRLTNAGTAPITGVHAETDLPFVTVQYQDGVTVMPVNRGYSIRDPQGALSVVVTASPTETCTAGVYEGKVTLTSPNFAEAIQVSLMISVGAGIMGTTVFEVRNEDNVLLDGAKVTLTGVNEAGLPIILDKTADENALAVFENIPAGDYTLRVNAEDHSTLETAITVAAVIDRTPRIVTLKQQSFSFAISEETVAQLHSSVVGSPNYDNLVWMAQQLADSSEPQLLPNFFADEKQFYYISGRLQNKLSFKDPDNADSAIEGIILRITDISANMPEGAVSFSAGGVLSPTKKVSVLRPGEVFDAVWSLDLEKFFRHAEVAAEEEAGVYTVTFPSETSREEINAYIAANDPVRDGIFTELSYDESTHTGRYRVPVNSDGSSAEPSDRVPIFYGETPYSFDFTIEASGVRSDNGETVVTRIPVRVHYIAPDYLINAGEKSPYDDNGNYIGQQYGDIYDIYPELEQKVSVEPAFGPASGKTSAMSYSSGFLSSIQMNVPQLPDEDDGVDLSFGFGSDVGFEGQVTRLSMKMKNPSKQYPMEDLILKLVLTDTPYGEDGRLLPGGSEIRIPITVRTTLENAETEDGKVSCEQLAPGGEAEFEYVFRVEDFIKTIDKLAKIDDTLAPYLERMSGVGKLYARFEISFVQNGEEHSTVSGVREYEVREQPKLHISYDLIDLGGGRYELCALVTNLGEGDARNFTMGMPTLPNTGFDMRITDVQTTKGTVQRGKNQSFDKVVIDVLRPGDTAKIEYWLAVVGELSNAQQISLGKLAAMPSIPVKSGKGNGIVVSPMKLESMRDQSAQAGLEELIGQVGVLESSLQLLTDKTAQDLGRSLTDYYDYIFELNRAVSIGEMFGMTANLVGAIAKVSEIAKEGTKIAGKLKEFKELKELLKDNNKLKKLFSLQEIMQKAEDGLEELIKNGKELWFLPIPVNYIEQYNKYQDAASAVNALMNEGALSEAFGGYVLLNSEAAQYLKFACEAAENAMTTADKTARADLASKARYYLEQANTLLKEAKILKDSGMEIYAGIQETDSNVDGDANNYSGLAEGVIRLQVNTFIAAAEQDMVTLIPAVATRLLQLQALSEVETGVENLKNASSQMAGIVGDEGPLAEEVKAMKEAAASIYETVGYDPNATPEENIKALSRSGEGFKSSFTHLFRLIFSDLYGLFDLSDSTTLQDIGETTPQMVKSLGEVLDAWRRGGRRGGADELCDSILTAYFGGAGSAYDWFKSEFRANFPAGGSDTEIERYVAASMIKLMPRQLVNETMLRENYDKIILEGKSSDYRANISAAGDAAAGRKINVYYAQNEIEQTIGEIIALLRSYQNDPTNMTSYYPVSQLLAYVKGLNTSIGAMVTDSQGNPLGSGRTGHYRNLWTYVGSGDDLTVKEIRLGDIYKAQIQMDSLIAEGYANVADRYNLNALRALESMTNIAGTAFGAAASDPVVGFATSAMSMMLDTSVYVGAQDTLDKANAYNLAKASADLSVTGNVMLSREIGIAADLKSVFMTMNGWRKVDPELPITLVTVDVTDAAAERYADGAYATAAISVRNDHSGSVTVAPTVEIYDSFGFVDSFTMGSRTLTPGEIGEFTENIALPVNMLRDMGGYIAVFSFAASEAETMTIAPTFGPYVTHFGVGTADTLAYLRDNGSASQPLGGTLPAGESSSAEITVPDGSSLRIFAAALPGSELSLTVAGVGPQQRHDHLNSNDFVLIPSASGTYTVTVTNNGETDFDYDLAAVITPDMGAVLGLVMPYANVTAGRYSYETDTGETVSGTRASLPVSLFETGLAEGMEIGIETSLLSNGENTVPAAVITDVISDDAVVGAVSLTAGGGRNLMLVYRPADGTPSGEYSGTVTFTVAADRFEADLSPYDWTRTDSGWQLTVPVKVRIDTAVPAAPVITSAVIDDGYIKAEGWSEPGSSVIICLAESESDTGTVKAVVSAGSDGSFSERLLPDGSGTWYVYAAARSGSGIMSGESARVPVEVNSGDVTPPAVTLIAPMTDVQLVRAVRKISFNVTENESALLAVPTLTVDGSEVEVRAAGGRSYEADCDIEDGTHTIVITAASEGGRTTERYTVIVGSSVEAVISTGVAGATVTMNGTSKQAGEDGKAAFSVKPGSYEYTAAKEGYIPVSGTATVTAAERTVEITLKPGKTLRVKVTDEAEAPVAGARAELGSFSGLTGEDGTAELLMPYGEYGYTVSAAGYRTKSGSMSLTAESADELAVVLAVNRSGKYPVYLRLVDEAGSGVTDASVTFDGETATSDINGEVLFLRSVGSYDAEIEAERYEQELLSVNVDASGRTQTVVLRPAGADYDEKYEILTVREGYTAFTEKTGGEEIESGSCFRGTEDRFVFIEGTDGIRVPLRIPLLAPDSEDWGEISYAWAENNGSITASRTHRYNPAHAESETVNTSSEITKAATCEAKGETTYTAVFEHAAFSAQNKTVKDIAALGHDWSAAEYQWSADNTAVTATRVCRNDAAHVESENVNTSSAVTTAATCEAAGKTTYTAVFTNTAFTTQTKTLANIPALGHEWGEAEFFWADDLSSARAVFTCIRDTGHSETVAAEVTAETTVEPTVDSEGKSVCTAAVSFEGRQYTDTREKVLPALEFAPDTNGLVQRGDEWIYVKDGRHDTSYTGLVENEYGWWYVFDGVLDLSFTGLVTNDYGTWFIYNGQLADRYTGLLQDEYGWKYIYNGRFADTYTGLVQNEYGWWYVRNGMLDFSYTGLVENEYGWWYVSGGVLDLSFTGLVTNDYGTWFIYNGQLAVGYTGLVQNGDKWAYVKDGRQDSTYTGLVENEYGWWYVSGGVLDLSFTGIVTNDYGTWYIYNGQLAVGYTGLVQNGDKWIYVSGGRQDDTYTGLVQNDYGWWYVSGGVLDLSFTGTVTNEYGTWNIYNGQVV
ncbi:MAG: PKD domain-containing protein [Oscillospiraceae bacterium]|nr:PKD domain-containing protein [Oscillospiraceae bacterium]